MIDLVQFFDTLRKKLLPNSVQEFIEIEALAACDLFHMFTQLIS